MPRKIPGFDPLALGAPVPGITSNGDFGAPAPLDPLATTGTLTLPGFPTPEPNPEPEPAPQPLPEIQKAAPLAPIPGLPEPEPTEPGLLQQVGDVLDRPGNALRGVLAGRLDALKGLIPFSETLGIYDPRKNHVSGQDVNQALFEIDAKPEDGLLSARGLAGLGTELLTDPLNLLPGFFGLKSLTKAGKAAELVGGHLDEAENLLKAYNTERKTAQAVAQAAEIAGEAGADVAKVARPVHPVLGDLLDATGRPVAESELVARMAQAPGKIGEAAQTVLQNSAEQGLGEAGLRTLPEAGDRVRAGQEALLSVGGEYNPFGLLGFIPGPVTKPWFELPTTTLIEGADTAQKIQDAGRAIKELPLIKQGLSLFDKTPGLSPEARQSFARAQESYRAKVHAGEREALQQSEGLSEALGKIQPGKVPPLEFEGDLVDPLTGEILQSAKPAPVPAQELPTLPWRQPNTASVMPLGQAEDLAQEEARRMPPAAGAPSWPLPNRTAKDAAQDITAEAPFPLYDLTPRREMPAQGITVTPLGEVGVPTLEDFEQVKAGHAVTFSPKDSISGDMGLKKQRRGIVKALDPNSGVATVRDSETGDQWLVPSSALNRKNAAGEFYQSKREYEAAQAVEGLAPEDAARLKNAARDTRDVFQQLADIPDEVAIQGGKVVNSAVKEQRDAHLAALGLDAGPKGQAQALPQIIEKVLSEGREVPPLRTVEFVDASDGAIGVGDKLKLGGDTFTVKEFTPEGKVKLKDGIPLEVPAGQIPKDKGSAIESAGGMEEVPNFDLLAPDFTPSKAQVERERAEATRGGGLNSAPGPRVIIPEEQTLRDSISQGEMRLRSKVNSLGEKLTQTELNTVAQTVDQAKAKLEKLATAKQVLAQAEEKAGVLPFAEQQAADAAETARQAALDAKIQEIKGRATPPKGAPKLAENPLAPEVPPPLPGQNVLPLELEPAAGTFAKQAAETPHTPAVLRPEDLQPPLEPPLPPKPVNLGQNVAKAAAAQQLERRRQLIEKINAGREMGFQAKYHDIERARNLDEMATAATKRAQVADYLSAAGVKADEAAQRAARILPPDVDPEVARRITDYMERVTPKESEEVAKVADAIQNTYAEMLDKEVKAGLETPKLKSRSVEYTTHTPTAEGHKFFQRIGKNKARQGELFAELERARQAKGLEANPEALRPRGEQFTKKPASKYTPRAIPKHLQNAVNARIKALDPATQDFIIKNGLQGAYNEFSEAISTTHGSQIARLPAYRDLGVTELNDIFKRFGAQTPVFNENPAAQLYSRQVRHVQAMAGKEFFDRVAEDLAKPKANMEARASGIPGVEQFSDGTWGVTDYNRQRGLQKLPPVGFDDPDTAAAFAKTFTKMTNPDEVGGLLDMFDKITRTWKGWITRAFPAYHARNHVSNRIQSYFAGVPITGEHYAEANRVLAGKTVNVALADGRVLDRDAVLKLAQDNGVVGGGWYENLVKEGLDPSKKPTWNPLDPNNRFIKTAERAGAGLAGLPGQLMSGNPTGALSMTGQALEDSDRLGHFIWDLKQGQAPTAAARDVNKFLFDYSKANLNNFEQKYMHRAVFFYGYMRNVLPMILDTALNNPLKIKQVTQLGLQPGQPDFKPPWAQEGLPIPLGKDAEGNSKMAYSLGTPVEAALEPFAPFAEGPQRGLQGLAKMLHPAFQIPMELASGKDFFLGKDIEENRKAPHYVEDMPQGVKDALGVVDVPTSGGQTKTEMDPWLLWGLNKSPLSRISNTLSKGVDERKTAAEKLLNLLSGSRIVSLDDEEEKKWAQRDAIKARLEELVREGKAKKFSNYGQNKAAGKDAEVAALLKALKG